MKQGIIFILLLGLGFSQTEVSQKVIDVTIRDRTTQSLDDLFPDYDYDKELYVICDEERNKANLGR